MAAVLNVTTRRRSRSAGGHVQSWESSEKFISGPATTSAIAACNAQWPKQHRQPLAAASRATSPKNPARHQQEDVDDPPAVAHDADHPQRDEHQPRVEPRSRQQPASALLSGSSCRSSVMLKDSRPSWFPTSTGSSSQAATTATSLGENGPRAPRGAADAPKSCLSKRRDPTPPRGDSGKTVANSGEMASDRE